MSFTESIRTCLRKTFVLSGRASRSEYWWFVLFITLYAIVAGAIFYFAAGQSLITGPGFAAIVLGIVLFVPMIWFYVASLFASVRRLHDRNFSGWWIGASIVLSVVSSFLDEMSGDSMLALVVSGVYLLFTIFILILTIMRGTEGPNKYGEDPLGYVDEAVFA